MKTDKKLKLAIWLNCALVLIMKLYKYNNIWSNGKSITVFKLMSSLSATNTVEHPVPYYSEQSPSQSSALRLRELVLAVTSLISPEDSPWFVSHHFSKPSKLQQKKSSRETSPKDLNWLLWLIWCLCQLLAVCPQITCEYLFRIFKYWWENHRYCH